MEQIEIKLRAASSKVAVMRTGAFPFSGFSLLI
jgi:hypothetical protein